MDDPRTDILAHVSWAIRSLYHSTLQATPDQLVFGQDMLLNIHFVAKWNIINEQKQRHMDNERENKSRIEHNYSVGDKVLVTSTKLQPKLHTPTRGPNRIIQTYTNDTVRIQNGIVTEQINIRRLISVIFITRYHFALPSRVKSNLNFNASSKSFLISLSLQ